MAGRRLSANQRRPPHPVAGAGRWQQIRRRAHRNLRTATVVAPGSGQWGGSPRGAISRRPRAPTKRQIAPEGVNG